MENPRLGSAGPGEDASLSGEEILFRKLADDAPVMIWRCSLDRRWDYFNRHWLHFTGRQLEDELGLGWTRGLAAEDYQRCLDASRASLTARVPFTLDFHLRRRDGVYRWILSNGVPFYRKGSFAGLLGSCVDISETQRGASSDTDTEMREAVLRQINHRVKNSLQTSISLSAFGREFADIHTQDDLSRIAERLALLAIAHEHVSRFGSAAGVDLCPYLHSLAGAVHAAIGAPHVQVRVSCEPAVLSKQRATAVGTIVDELITAALLHRFPAERTGTVQVESRPLPEDRIEISISDDGLAEASRLPPAQASYERQLLERLTAHANGTIRYELDRGTRCVITLDSE